MAVVADTEGEGVVELRKTTCFYRAGRKVERPHLRLWPGTQAEKFSKSMQEIYQFIRTDFTYGETVVAAMKAEEDVVLPDQPVMPDNPDDDVEMDIYQELLKSYVKRFEIQRANLRKAYGVILGQCSPNLRRMLETLREWKRIDNTADVYALIKSIKVLVFQREVTTNVYEGLSKAVYDFYHLTQPYNQSDEAYFNAFKSRYNVVHQNGGLLGAHPILITKELGDDPLGLGELVINDANDKGNGGDGQQSENGSGGSHKEESIKIKIEGSGLKSSSFYYGGDGGDDDNDEYNVKAMLVPKAPQGNTPENRKTIQRAMRKAEQAYLATCFIRQANRDKHGSLQVYLENAYVMGRDKYPKTMTEAYNLLINFKSVLASISRGKGVEYSNEGVTLANQEQKEGEENPYKNSTCWKCKKKGHLSRGCPEKKDDEKKGAGQHFTNATVQDGKSAVVVEIKDGGGKDDESRASSIPSMIPEGKQYDPKTNCVFATLTEQLGEELNEFALHLDHKKQNHNALPSSWLLLNSESTCNVFNDKSLIDNLQKASRPAIIHSNGGSNKAIMKGTFASIPDVWYDPHSLANILLLGKLSQTHRVTFDTEKGNKFIVHTGNQELEFKMSPKGLYYHDMAEGKDYHALVNTVKGNLQGFTTREIKQAKKAKEAVAKLGFPSLVDPKAMVSSGFVKNMPFNIQDINVAQKIFGPDVPSLKGKTTRRSSPQVMMEFVHVPKEIYERNKLVILAVDIMKVGGLPFLVTASLKLDLITVEYLNTMKVKQLTEALGRAPRVYHNKGMRVVTAMTDNQFNPVRGLLGSADLNTTAANEHVPVIERKIRVIKERYCALRSTLPYPRLPARFIIEAIVFCVMWLNAVPSKSGVSSEFSPRMIMTNTTLDFSKHCKLPFGASCQVFQQNEPTNTDVEHTVDAICLDPTGNARGSYKFFSLDTCQRILRHQYTEVPVTKATVQCVTAIAE
mmetsp:Transcript_1688/g.3611  ORF Transcript_1688/g.3611 Transcript_1688/m.3611 type:complete len:966 (+) Transcript_1688:108-3005(+)